MEEMSIWRDENRTPYVCFVFNSCC